MICQWRKLNQTSRMFSGKIKLLIWIIICRFIDIVDRELNVNLEMATYVKENLFTIDIDEVASEIYEVIIETKYNSLYIYRRRKMER